jgi:hypothetical protein
VGWLIAVLIVSAILIPGPPKPLERASAALVACFVGAAFRLMLRLAEGTS